jgi:hypothetical protein
VLFVQGTNSRPDLAKITQLLERNLLLIVNIFLVCCNSELKESASFLNQLKLMALSISDSINSINTTAFSCNFSHLEHFHSELVLVLHFPFISIAVADRFFLRRNRFLQIKSKINNLSEFGLYADIFKQSMGARNRVGIGLSYRPARLQRLAESIPGLHKSLKIPAFF